MSEPKRRKLWMPAIVFALVAGWVGLAAFQFRSGVRIIVENAGTSPLKSVVLHVTGASYALGDIAVGKSATMRVRPTGESHLEIEFTRSDGETRRLDAGGYFEPGYLGAMRVEIKDGQIFRVEEDIRLR
ncbi:hypothetical protein [Candidatus Laterigemmans baculatus]|uniref:hypothetical protein n=1 Tax=Candidatus Laterigemmans baculatus TaxID=2770505 RepID=UPI0013DAEA31|nr:hypothetical protein [Candidatus Laterigemmans baculatus]